VRQGFSTAVFKKNKIIRYAGHPNYLGGLLSFVGKKMTLETQVASLVNATTDLSAVVNAELAKVRTENANFKATVVEKALSATDNSLVIFDGISGKNIRSQPNIIVDANGCTTFDTVFIGSGNGPQRAITNCAVGRGTTLGNNTTGVYNTALGTICLVANTTGYANTAVGIHCLKLNTTGVGNVGIGVEALGKNVSGHFNTAIGHVALWNSSANNVTNCVGLGYETEVTGSNQIQLGNAVTTTFVYGTVQNRSDERDKADIRPTLLGLEFIKLLRPVDYRWDMRDFYRLPVPKPLDDDASEEQIMAYEVAVKEYQEKNKINNITRDGSKKKKRYHHGLIAQEIQALIRTTGMDFGGYQDHKISGGQDVLSIGYDEFVAPLIKAMQELAQIVEDQNDRIAALEAKAV
jgi:hypothetical protein